MLDNIIGLSMVGGYDPPSGGGIRRGETQVAPQRALVVEQHRDAVLWKARCAEDDIKRRRELGV
jgi:hypothetical protein